MSKSRKTHVLSPEALSLVATRFRVLSEPLRLRILQELQVGERTVGDLTEAVESTQPNVSKHLKLLQEHGVVARRQSGNNVFYSIADPAVFDLCDTVCNSIQTRMTGQARLVTELGKGMKGK